jgi:hypothetical protein
MQALLQQILPAGSREDRLPERDQAQWQLRIWKQGDPERTAAEAFIRERFQHSYDADVCVFLPYLLGITNASREITSVIGLRPAIADSLFLENYLDQPAEQALAAATGNPVARKQIIEVGNLASSNTESFRNLMIGLITLLDRLPDTRWMMCTVGERLIRLLQRTRFFPLLLSQAKQQCLSEKHGDWGSYYQHTRKVVAGNVAYGMRELKRQDIWRPEFSDRVNQLLQEDLLK